MRRRHRIAELEELLRVARADADNQRKLATRRGEKLAEIRRVLGPAAMVTTYGGGGGGGGGAGITVTPTLTTYD